MKRSATGCSVEEAMRLLGGRWRLLLVSYLLDGPKRFADLRRDVDTVRPKLESRFAWVDRQLAGKDFLMGGNFTIADAYLFSLTGWGRADWMKSVYNADIDLTPLRNLQTWYERIRSRAAVQRVLAADGMRG